MSDRDVLPGLPELLDDALANAADIGPKRWLYRDDRQAIRVTRISRDGDEAFAREAWDDRVSEIRSRLIHAEHACFTLHVATFATHGSERVLAVANGDVMEIRGAVLIRRHENGVKRE